MLYKWNKHRLFISLSTSWKSWLRKEARKTIKNVNRYNKYINNIQEIVTSSKDRNHKSKKKYQNYKTLNTILESIDTIVIIGATSTFITLSITGNGLFVLPISTEIACFLSLDNEVLHKIIINECKKHKTYMKESKQTVKPFGNLYSKSLQDNLIDKSEY